MRITESQLRRIVREEIISHSKSGVRKGTMIESVLGMDVLTPVPVSLIAGRARAGRMTDYQLLEVYFSRRRGLLTEAHVQRAELIMEFILDGLVSTVQAVGGKAVDFAKELGKAGVEAAKSAASKAGAAVGEVVDGVKAAAAKASEIMTYVIMQIPGGETVLNFLKDTASQLSEIIKQTAAYMKDKIQGWVKTAKTWFMDYLINDLFDKNPDLKDAVTKKLGLTDSDLKDIEKTAKSEGIRSVKDYNRVMEERESRRGRLRTEAPNPEAAKAAATGGQTVVDTAMEVKDLATDTAKFMGALASDQPISPEDLARKFAAAAIKRLIGVVMEVCSASRKLYEKCIAPIWSSPLFSIFRTGFGLISSAFLGIMASGSVGLDTMVEYIKGITYGWQKKDAEARTAEVARERGVGANPLAAAKTFMANKGKLLIDLMVGLISGSNLEVIVRALSGDPTKMVDGYKRLAGLILNAIRAAMKKHGPAAVQRYADSDADRGNIGDEAESAVGIALGMAIDAIFPT